MGHTAPLEKKAKLFQHFFARFSLFRRWPFFLAGVAGVEAGKFSAGIKIGLFSVAARMAKGNTRRRRLVWAFQHVVESGSFFHLSGEVRGMGKDRCGLKASLLEFGGRGEEGVG